MTGRCSSLSKCAMLDTGSKSVIRDPKERIDGIEDTKKRDLVLEGVGSALVPSYRATHGEVICDGESQIIIPWAPLKIICKISLD